MTMPLLFAQQQQVDPAFLVGVLIGALVVGLLGGLIVKKIADSREQPALGWIGFVVTLVVGFLFGLLGAVPSVILFSIIAFVMPAPSRKRRSWDDDRDSPYAKPRTPSQNYDL